LNLSLEANCPDLLEVIVLCH